MEYPRWTSLSDEERRKIGVGQPSSDSPSPSRSRLLKVLTCAVTYPDGTEGKVEYERLGPAYHRFRFRYLDGRELSRIYHTRPLEGGAPAIEEFARDKAADAFRDAMETERKDWFARATEPTSGSRKADTSRPQASVKDAKGLGGRYALCLRIGAKLIPVSGKTEKFELAAAWWGSRKDPGHVIACFSRLDRRWELLRLNPLVNEGHPRRE